MLRAHCDSQIHLVFFLLHRGVAQSRMGPDKHDECPFCYGIVRIPHDIQYFCHASCLHNNGVAPEVDEMHKENARLYRMCIEI